MRKIKFNLLAIFFMLLAFDASFVYAAKKSKKSKAQKSEQSSVRPPDWVNSKPAAYPESRYLTASGSANFEKAADQDALANLASVFNQIISSNTNASRKMRQDTDESVSKESAYSQDVSVIVDQSELTGVEIKERFFDGKKHYSLAVLDKVEAAKIYVSAIEENNKEIARLESFSQADQFSMERCANLFIAQEKAEQNKGYIDRLFVIDSDQAKRMSTKSPQDFRAQRVEIARQIPIFVKVSGDKDSFVQKKLCDMLTSLGFRFSSDPAERYSLTGDFSLEQKMSTDKESMQTFYSFSCALKDSAMSTALWSDSFKGRASSFNEADSLDRAKNAVGKRIQKNLAESFMNFLRGAK